MNVIAKQICSSALALFYGAWFEPLAQAYAFNMIVPDVRQPAAVSGGSACPVKARQLTSAGSIAIQWSTALNANPVTIVTQNQTTSGRPTEIEQVITQSMAVWAAVNGTTLVPATFAPLARTATQNACGSDGLNTICFDQADMAFTPGVVAFTRVIETDRIGLQVGSSAVATQLGQILDADIYFNPSDSRTTYATPQALAATPTAYDLESVLTHELGHLLGFSHSAIWSAMMFPFAPAPGTISGTRPTTVQPDAPLGDDDRTGLRVLYPDPADTVHQGSISGKIIPANPLALPASPPAVTGVFGSHVVAVDAASGAAVAATLGGWSCSAPGPAQFDGTYEIDGLAVGRSYTVYAEALNGAADPSRFTNAIVPLCRNTVSDAGWPPLQGCVVPTVDLSFTARTRPGP
jgi:Matrixin